MYQSPPSAFSTRSPRGAGIAWAAVGLGSSLLNQITYSLIINRMSGSNASSIGIVFAIAGGTVFIATAIAQWLVLRRWFSGFGLWAPVLIATWVGLQLLSPFISSMLFNGFYDGGGSRATLLLIANIPLLLQTIVISVVEWGFFRRQVPRAGRWILVRLLPAVAVFLLSGLFYAGLDVAALPLSLLAGLLRSLIVILPQAFLLVRFIRERLFASPQAYPDMINQP